MSKGSETSGPPRGTAPVCARAPYQRKSKRHSEPRLDPAQPRAREGCYQRSLFRSVCATASSAGIKNFDPGHDFKTSTECLPVRPSKHFPAGCPPSRLALAPEARRNKRAERAPLDQPPQITRAIRASNTSKGNPGASFAQRMAREVFTFATFSAFSNCSVRKF